MMHSLRNVKGRHPPLILFANPPALDVLQSLAVFVPDKTLGSGKFQPQVIKCRYVSVFRNYDL